MRFEGMSDEALVKYLQTKVPLDEAGWALLLEQYERLIWYYIPNGYPYAQDLYADIQKAIYTALRDRYDGKGKVLSYVGGIIVNRVKSRDRIESKETLGEEFDTTSAARVDSQPEPAHKVLSDEAGIRVKMLFDTLKPKEQKVIILRYLGYSHKQICSIVGIRSEGASRKYLNKVARKVKRHSDKLDIDPDQFREGMNSLLEEGKLHEILNQ